MNTQTVSLAMTGAQHAAIRSHLFPGDGKEAAAIALCRRGVGSRMHRLLVREVHPVPYAICRRSAVQLAWPVEWLDPLVDRAAHEQLSLVKLHSHPTGYDEFSAADDASDADLFRGIHAWIDRPMPHASVVMLPDGTCFGRTVDDAGRFTDLHAIAMVGDDIRFWHADMSAETSLNGIGRTTMAFGRSMMADLRRLTIAVVGCSGTGSLVAEQLARLGVGRLILVDPDRVTRKNLNRIVNATEEDARHERFKVEVLARAIAGMGLKTEVECHPVSLLDRSAIAAVAGCDAVFGCVDSVEGRHILNRIATYYLLPYIDIGVGLVASASGVIEQINGVVHYLQPGCSSLLSRCAYRPEQLAGEALARSNPAEYEQRRKERYIEGAREEEPAVISVNMTMASLGVNEFLARLYRYRNMLNSSFATLRINLTEMELIGEQEGRTCRVLSPKVGMGDCEPPLDLLEFSRSVP